MRSLPRHLLFCSLLFVAGFAAACGGGSTPTPPPPSGNYSNSSLKGTYVFSMSGQDIGGFFARVGVFVADGNGNITGGVEDVNTAATFGTQPIAFSSSSYSIQADGRGTLNLSNITGTISFSLALSSTTQGFMAQTDGIATASGVFYLQDPASFSTGTAPLNNAYVFDFSGIDGNGNSDSIVGQFLSGNNGTIVNGVLDENDAATASGPVPFSTGNYSMDTTYGNFGRGFINIGGGLNYVFYIVNGSRFRMIENDQNFITIGDATTQSGSVPTTNAALNGAFASILGGSSQSTFGPISRGGRFNLDGSGNLASLAWTTNDAGNSKQIPTNGAGSLSKTTYAIDTNFPGSGRGTLTFTDSKLGTFSYIFYLNSASQGVIQDNSLNNVADGAINAQSAGPFTNSGLAGNWVLNFSGLSSNNQTGFTGEEDYVGQFALSSASSSNVSGAVDFSAFSSTAGVFLNIVLNGNLTVNGDGTASNGTPNKLQATVKTSPSSTLNFDAYILNNTTIYVISTDNNRTTNGILTTQATP